MSAAGVTGLDRRWLLHTQWSNHSDSHSIWHNNHRHSVQIRGSVVCGVLVKCSVRKSQWSEFAERRIPERSGSWTRGNYELYTILYESKHNWTIWWPKRNEEAHHVHQLWSHPSFLRLSTLGWSHINEQNIFICNSWPALQMNTDILKMTTGLEYIQMHDGEL